MGDSLELISLEVWHVVASILNLLILTLILKKFLFKPVHNMLDKRKEQVDSLYRDAEQSRQKAEEDRALYGEKLAGAVEEADAKRRAAETVKQAEEDIEQAKKKAMDELKNEVAGISVQIAENVVGRELNGDDHKELIDSFIDRL